MMVNELIGLTNQLKKINKFEFVDLYFSSDDLIKKMMEINPFMTYSFFYESICDDNFPLVLVVIDSSLHQFNIYSEDDVLTLKDLVK